MFSKDQRITELEATVERLERKLAACETAIEAMIARRKRLVPESFDDPANEALFRAACERAVEGWQKSDAEREAARRQIIFEQARAKAIEGIELSEAKENAEVIEAIEFYQREGRSPAGFVILEPESTQ